MYSSPFFGLYGTKFFNTGCELELRVLVIISVASRIIPLEVTDWKFCKTGPFAHILSESDRTGGEDLSRPSTSADSSHTLKSPVSFAGQCAAGTTQILESCEGYQIIYSDAIKKIFLQLAAETRNTLTGLVDNLRPFSACHLLDMISLLYNPHLSNRIRSVLH